jgi:hypothetical protein
VSEVAGREELATGGAVVVSGCPEEVAGVAAGLEVVAAAVVVGWTTLGLLVVVTAVVVVAVVAVVVVGAKEEEEEVGTVVVILVEDTEELEPGGVLDELGSRVVVTGVVGVSVVVTGSGVVVVGSTRFDVVVDCTGSLLVVVDMLVVAVVLEGSLVPLLLIDNVDCSDVVGSVEEAAIAQAESAASPEAHSAPNVARVLTRWGDTWLGGGGAARTQGRL